MISGKADYRTEELVLRVQSKKASFVETLTSTFVGLGIAIWMNYILFAWYAQPKYHVLSIAAWMTLVSVIRGYVLRRLFNTEFWKRWRRGRVVTECNIRSRTIAQLAGDLQGLSREQRRKFNSRLLDLLDKEVSRVLYGRGELDARKTHWYHG